MSNKCEICKISSFRDIRSGERHITSNEHKIKILESRLKEEISEKELLIEREQKLKEENYKLKEEFKKQLAEARLECFNHIRQHDIQVSHQDNHSKLSKADSLFSTSCKSSFHHSLSKILGDLDLNLNVDGKCEQCNDFSGKYKNGMELDPNELKSKDIYSKNIVFDYNGIEQNEQNEVLNDLKMKYPTANISVNDFNEASTTISISSSKIIHIRSLKNFNRNGIVPIVRKFTYEERKALGYKLENIPHTQILKDLKDFLIEPSKLICKALSEDLKNIILNINILVHSEYVLSAIFFNLSCEIGQDISWESLRLISLDSKMEIYSQDDQGEDKANAFRCDFIAIYKKYLFIFEHKYRHNRKNSQVDFAMRCLERKKYVKKVCYFMSNNPDYKVFIKDTTHVISVGVGYSVFKNNDVFCEMKYIKEKISQYLNLSVDSVICK
jgi:hypothetical protein